MVVFMVRNYCAPNRQNPEGKKEAVCSVGTGTISGLLNEFLKKQVLNREEVQFVKSENSTVMGKARVFVDGLIVKGPACKTYWLPL